MDKKPNHQNDPAQAHTHNDNNHRKSEAQNGEQANGKKENASLGQNHPKKAVHIRDRHQTSKDRGGIL